MTKKEKGLQFLQAFLFFCPLKTKAGIDMPALRILSDPGGTRTHNLQNRNLTFYPIELRDPLTSGNNKSHTKGTLPKAVQI